MNLDQDATPAGRAENYYEVLGLAPGATDEEIEAAYADLSSMFAPGKVPASRQEYARRQRSRLAAAYAVLADPDQRASYDRRLGGGAPPAAPPLPQELQAAEAQISSAPGAATDLDAADLPGRAPVAEVPVAEAPEAPVSPPVESAVEAAPGPAVLPWEAPALEQTRPLTEVSTVIAPVAPEAAAEPEIEEDASAEEPWEEEDEAGAEEPWEDEDEGAEEPWEEEDEAELSEDDIPPPPPARPARPGQPAAGRVAAAPTRGTAPPPSPVRGAAPGGARPAPGVRVEPARPAAKSSSPAVPPPRTGGVALPSRREAAQITARQQAAPPPPVAAAPRVARRPVAPPARRYEYEEEEAPRYRQAAPPPPRPRRKRRNNNRLAYQIMTLVIGLVLVVGTVASVVQGISSSGSTTTGTSQTDTATLIAQGNTALQQNNPSAALSYFQQVYSVAPTNLDALLGLAEAYAQRNGPGDTAQAQSYASQVIQQGQNSTQAQQAIQILAALSNTPAAGSPAAATPTEVPSGAGTPTP